MINENVSRKIDGAGRVIIPKHLRSKLEFTEPKIKVNNELYEGLKKATKDGLQEAIKKFLPEARESLSYVVKNYDGISQKDFDNIKKTAEIGWETELNVLKTNSLTNRSTTLHPH